MKIVIVMDSFKGSLSSKEAGEAVKEGILAADADADVLVYSFADGGEGTLEAFLEADSQSHRVEVLVSDPLGRKVGASYGVLSDGTVVIETAQATGLCLLRTGERDPLHTTTRGVGELIRHAVKNRYRKFIVALGGSATNDCGTGMLKELGFGIFNDRMEPVEDGAAGLSTASVIKTGNAIPELKDCSFTIACDVKNPLFGTFGASRVFAPQKGAKAGDVEKMDLWMEKFSGVVKKSVPDADPYAEGTGAAGGLGFAFRTFLNGKMKPGAEVLLERTEIEEEMATADLVITGEGQIDRQTSMGKAPVRIAQVAKRYNRPVIAIAGCVFEGSEKCHDAGIDAIFPTVPGPMDEKDAMARENAAANVKRTACEVIRLCRSACSGQSVY